MHTLAPVTIGVKQFVRAHCTEAVSINRLDFDLLILARLARYIEVAIVKTSSAVGALSRQRNATETQRSEAPLESRLFASYVPACAIDSIFVEFR